MFSWLDWICLTTTHVLQICFVIINVLTLLIARQPQIISLNNIHFVRILIQIHLQLHMNVLSLRPY